MQLLKDNLYITNDNYKLSDDIQKNIDIMKTTNDKNVFLNQLKIINSKSIINENDFFQMINKFFLSTDIFYLSKISPSLLANYEYMTIEAYTRFLHVQSGVLLSNILELHKINWNIFNVNDRLNYLHTHFGININKYRPSNMPREDVISFKGIDYMINNAIYAFDLMTRHKHYFIIDTTYVNKYDINVNCIHIGVKAYFTLNKTGFKLCKIIYNNKIYYKTNNICNNTYIALYLLWIGLCDIITVCNHVTRAHGLVSGKLCGDSWHILNNNNKIKELLLPSHINNVNAFIAAYTILFTNNGIFKNITSFSDIGLKSMINDHYKIHKNDFYKDDFKRLKFTPLQLTYYPIKTYYKYYMLYKQLANDYVNKCFKTSRHVDKSTRDWVKHVYPYKIYDYKKVIKRIITGIYYENIRHKMYSNDILLYAASKYPNINYNNGQYSVNITTQYLTYYNLYITNCIQIPIKHDTSFLITNKKLRKIVHAFYKRLNYWNKHYKNHVILLKPSEISTSISF